MIEFRCLACRHRFPWFSADGPESAATCPRCGASTLEPIPWLLGSDLADLLPDDYLESALAA